MGIGLEANFLNHHMNNYRQLHNDRTPAIQVKRYFDRMYRIQLVMKHSSHFLPAYAMNLAVLQ